MHVQGDCNKVFFSSRLYIVWNQRFIWRIWKLLRITQFLCNPSTTAQNCGVHLWILHTEHRNLVSWLTHWGPVMHICVSKVTIIGKFSSGRHQAIIWTNAWILLIGPLGTNFSEILIEFLTFSFTKMHFKVSSAKWRPFGLGLNVLKHWGQNKMVSIWQTTFSNAFSCMKMYEFHLRFHWTLFLRFQLTIFQHWFRLWFGADQVTSHNLNQWWLIQWRMYGSLGLNELKETPVLLEVTWHFVGSHWPF